jgi:hypothetical protein
MKISNSNGPLYTNQHPSLKEDARPNTTQIRKGKLFETKKIKPQAKK